MTSFRIFALCVIKNEADIIEQTLRAAARWCDVIYVLDNGSVDGSWEIVTNIPRELPCVVPFRQDPCAFEDDIRNVIFDHFRTRARRGDWWAILDADEFYVDDPRTFLANVPRRFSRVWLQAYNFLFTDVDLAAYMLDKTRFDASVPIAERSRYFVLADYSQLRCFRHSRLLTRIPYNDSGRVFPRRIRLRHYMYRSPEQIQRRLDTRREPMQRGEFLHELRSAWTINQPARPDDQAFPESWSERLVAASECHFDTGDETLPDDPWTAPRSAGLMERVAGRTRRLARRAKVRRAG
jgi:hypothetical protein